MMKLIRRPKPISLALLAALLLAPGFASAQVPGPSASIMNSAFLKLFGVNTNFSCKAEIHILDAIQKETDVTPFGFTVSGTKLRMDIDFTQLKGADIPAMLPTLKQLGMDEAIIILRPDEQLVIGIYPKARAFCEKPMSKDEIAAYDKAYTSEKTKLGKEAFDGHPCEKSTVTLTDEKGVKHAATVWNATDLKDFPVQIQMAEQESAVRRDYTLVMKFRDVKLGKPDPSRFEAPAGFTKYKSDEALMEAATKGSLAPAK